MESRQNFAKHLAELSLSHAERAIALLWYYRQTQEFDERTASELANDLHDEGFPKPRISRLHRDLTRNRFTIRGRRANTFQLDLRHITELDEKYGVLLKIKKVQVDDLILPSEWVSGTRAYLERLVHQINGCYDFGFYDACAALCRRLMESLIIETYIYQGRHHEIQKDGIFVHLEKLIAYIRTDKKVTLGRNSYKTMTEIKQLGDTAAHDRVYITHQQDLDDAKTRYRRMIKDLLGAAHITK